MEFFSFYLTNILSMTGFLHLREQWVHLDMGVNVVKSVNTSLKLKLLLVVSLEKLKSIIV